MTTENNPSERPSSGMSTAPRMAMAASTPRSEDVMDSRLDSINSEAKRIWVSKILGRAIGPFRVLDHISEDDTGAVFKATDTQKERLVRLKVLWLKVAMDDTSFARFVRAMRTTMGLKHPNLVRLYAAGKDGEYCYMASEFFDGDPLSLVAKRRGKQGALDWKTVLGVAKDMAAALDAIFERKIIHRDIKPNNIILGDDGVAKLDNLIVAKAIEGAQQEQISIQGSSDLVGDLCYMAPEALLGDTDVDCRCDLYSLGAALYTILTGRPPFQAPSVLQLGRMIQTKVPDSPRTIQPDIPEAFERIILKLLAKKAEDRFQTPAELVRELASIPA